MGSKLNSKDELDYYSTIASLAQQVNSQLAGWIWWAYNANSAGEQLHARMLKWLRIERPHRNCFAHIMHVGTA
jgi:hypothetical protein